jgi:hypothetical protein
MNLIIKRSCNGGISIKDDSAVYLNLDKFVAGLTPSSSPRVNNDPVKSSTRLTPADSRNEVIIQTAKSNEDIYYSN